MISRWFSMAIFAVLLLSQPATAANNRCYGSVLLTSDPADVFEEYANRVKVYVPLKIQVSDSLLGCADEIWIEPVYSNKFDFYGPWLVKTAKLLDAQLKSVSAKKGTWKVDLNDRVTQLWARMRHYSLFPAGSYTTRVWVAVVVHNQIIDEQYIDLNYYSEPKISISLDTSSQGKVSGSNGDYQIDLGELQTNAKFDWGINILSNSAYDMILDSEFNGLRHETNHSAVIDYTIEFDNVKIPSWDWIYRRYDYASGVNNTWFGFSFVLGNVDLMPAGHYQDNLSLTIYPY